MINMANAASTQALAEGKKRLREFLEANDVPPQRVGMRMEGRRGGEESYEMTGLNGRSRNAAGGLEDEEGEDDI